MKLHKMQLIKGGHEKSLPSNQKRQVLDIPIPQLLPDPHQPRKKFDPVALQELAESIRSQGLQQYPSVNFAFMKDGKPYYYLKAGERRWRAHQLLKYQTMTCVVEEKIYTGVYDIKRKIAQAAENDSREPQSKAEIVQLTREAVAHEQETRKVHGATQIALNIIATAFGKSLGWATNYHTLGGLIPELCVMLDDDNEGEKLNWKTGLALARTPPEDQLQIFEQSKLYFESGGNAAQYAFIVAVTREIREGRGEKMRGRASDARVGLVRFVRGLNNHVAKLYVGRTSDEYTKHVEGIVATLGVSEVDGMLSDIEAALRGVNVLKKALDTKRKNNYRSFGQEKD